MDGISVDKKADQILETSDLLQASGTAAAAIEKDDAAAVLKTGQQVTGTVQRIDHKEVIFRILGREVSAPREMFQDTVVGDTRSFEVLRINGNKIELRSADHRSEGNNKSFVSVLKINTDQGILLSRKRYAGRQAEKERDLQGRKDKIEEILSKITEQDYRTLEEEGFSVEDFTVEGLDAALRRIKNSNPSDRGLGISTAKKQHERKLINQNTNITEQEIQSRLREENLPITGEIVQKIRTALVLSDAVKVIDEQAIKNLIRQELPPTIENIYKAKYTGNKAVEEKHLSEDAWGELVPQVKEVVETAGFAVDSENMKKARWLVENNLPLTKENMQYLSELDRLKDNSDKELVLDKIVQGVGNGILPKDVLMIPESTEDMHTTLDKINSITNNAVIQAVKIKKEITIKTLSERNILTEKETDAFSGKESINNQEDGTAAEAETIEESMKQLPGFKELTKEQQLEALKAQRNLEEIRLRMTTEAASRLEKKGFHIETERLEKVVEQLKKMEDSYYRDLLSEADMEPDEKSIETLKAVTTGMERLKQTPSYVLGITLAERKLQTIPKLLETGSQLLADINKAKDVYETLMTVPNAEYGDSIQKAFHNAASLLAEMSIEDTELNRRAVRILGYNRMEITEEAIDLVKAYDLEVNNLMRNLHPAVTVRMIKQGQNPMEIPISELNDRIKEIKEEQGISAEEKYSTFLRKLEKEDGISEQERKTYIGIYRLLHSIEKTDGAALGAVLKADREVTLENLLTAVRTTHKGYMDTIVDDNFGSLQKLSYNGETITDQIAATFGSISESNNGQVAGQPSAGYEAKAEVINTLLNQLLEEVTPGKLKELQKNLASPAPTLSQGTAGNGSLSASDQSLWDIIKEVSPETLHDKFTEINNMEVEVDNASIYTEKLREIRQVYKNCDQSLRFLENLKIPCTTANIAYAGQILSNGGTLFKKLYQLKDENSNGNSKNSLKEISKLADTLIDKNSVNETYERLEEEVKAVVEQESQSERIDVHRLAELKSLGAQISLLKDLAGREFYQIPVEANGQITNLNLTVVRGSGLSGKVTISYDSTQLGKIKADLTLKDKTLSGYIACDNRAGLDKLQKNMDEIEVVFQEDNIVIKQLDLCLQKMENDMHSHQIQEEENTDSVQKPDNERLLYRIARGMVLTLRSAESADWTGNAAVS